MSRNGNKSALSWLVADIDGLEKTARRRGLAWILFELVQNAWDTKAKNVDFKLEPVEGRPRVRMTCEDDDPNGFEDLSHTYKMFAESKKKANPMERGRWNAGEKYVLAVCEEARVVSTKGTIIFNAEGRSESRVKREIGSMFSGIVKMNREELAEVLAAAELLIPPEGVTTYVNGKRVEPQQPLGKFRTTLRTEIGDADGVLRPTRRQTDVRVYNPLPGKSAYLYEMGIPVVEMDFPWSVDVQQKIPLNQDRDNVPPAFLKELHVETINAMHANLPEEKAALPSVVETLADQRITKEAANTVLTYTQGEKRALFDATDVEAGNRLVGKGYTVIPSRGLPPGAAKNLRALGVLQTATEISPTPKPYSNDPNAPMRELLPESEWTVGMVHTINYAKALAQLLLGVEINVNIDKGKMNRSLAAYGGRELTFSLGSLGRKWFDRGLRAELDDLLLHEFAHHFEGNHLAEGFHEACTRLGAKLVEFTRGNPGFFQTWGGES